MDNSGGEREEEVFDIIRHPEAGAEDGEIGDGSEFLNETGEGMGEPEQSIDEAQTSVDCDDQAVTKIGEVY